MPAQDESILALGIEADDSPSQAGRARLEASGEPWIFQVGDQKASQLRRERGEHRAAVAIAL